MDKKEVTEYLRLVFLNKTNGVLVSRTVEYFAVFIFWLVVVLVMKDLLSPEELKTIIKYSDVNAI